MTKSGGFKRVVREHAQTTGQRYTEARDELEGDSLDERVFYTVGVDDVRDHLDDRFGGGTERIALCGWHSKSVFRADRSDGAAWVVRVFPRARPMARVEGDVAILSFLERHRFPGERLVGNGASVLDGQGVIVTEAISGPAPTPGLDTLRSTADLLGRLHALEPGGSIAREGGSFGHDTAREGCPSQDLVAARLFLAEVAPRVSEAGRPTFERLLERINAADAGEGLPDVLLHSDPVPEHAIDAPSGLHLIHWQASGIGPRVAELAWFLDGTGIASDGGTANIDVVIDAYRQHVELTDEELDRLADIMLVKPLYLTAWYYWRSLTTGNEPRGTEAWWGHVSEVHAQAVAHRVSELLR